MFPKEPKQRVVMALCGLSLVLVLGGFFWAYGVLRAGGGNPFIIHFNDFQGITQVGGLGAIIFMGIFGALVVVMNFFVATELTGRDRFLGTLTAAMTLLFAALLFIAFIAILNVN